jgi:hypothetical protein
MWETQMAIMERMAKSDESRLDLDRQNKLKAEQARYKVEMSLKPILAQTPKTTIEEVEHFEKAMENGRVMMREMWVQFLKGKLEGELKSTIDVDEYQEPGMTLLREARTKQSIQAWDNYYAHLRRQILLFGKVDQAKL